MLRHRRISPVRMPLLVMLAAGFLFATVAENIVFPAGAGLKNVVIDYGAKGDGTTDDTKALQDAFGVGNAYAIYVPNGTYKVTAPILCRTASRGPWIYGQSRAGVVIKLADNTPGFGNSSSPQAIIAAHGIKSGEPISADFFYRQWRNFTVDAGNNAGAIGMRYYANNCGILDNVLIKGNGVYGLDMGWANLNGPLLVRNVVIEGFGTGVYTNNGPNSQTMSNVTIRNCRTLGISAVGQVVSIEDLVVENVPMAIDANCMMMVINGTFKGSDATKPAIRNRAHLFCRNITTQGFSRAIESPNGGVSGATVTEFGSENTVSAFTDFRRTSLNLPIKKTPVVPWEEDTSKWVSVKDFGALPGDRFEDTKGIQDAINAAAAAGKTTVCIPSGTYTVINDIQVHGPVRHIIGIGNCEVVLTYSSTEDRGFVLREDAAPVVLFSDMIRCGGLTLTTNNTSAVVMENCVGIKLRAAGSGDAFLNNNVSSLVITNKAAHVWARQWNTEGSGVDSDNQGGFLWILGLKTEKRHMKVRTTNGGMTEVLGAHIYNNDCTGSTRLFEITDAYASFACIREMQFCGGPYPEHVGETRSGVTKTWVDNTDRAWALYSGAPASFAPPAVTGVRQRFPPAAKRQPVDNGRNSLHRGPGEAVVYTCQGARARFTGTGRLQSAAGVYVVKTREGVRRVPAGWGR